MNMSDPAEDPFDEMYRNKGLGPMHPEDPGDEYWPWPQCPDCGFARTCKACVAEDEFNEYLDERVARLGPELAMLPDFMECYDCGRQHLMVMTDPWGFKFVWRRPVGLGPIAEAHRDPTQTYVLECGHGAM